MLKMWLVAKHEYLTMVRHRSFLIGTLGLPALLAAFLVIIILIVSGNRDSRPVGYVDESGVLAARIDPSIDGVRQSVGFQAYPDWDAAQIALRAGQIQAFYVLDAGYLQNQQIALYYWDKQPSESVQIQFDNLVRANLLANTSDAIRNRILEGPNLIVRSADGNRDVRGNFMAFVLPFVVGFFFMMATMTSAGYLLEAVTTEKENRTMEVMITSLTPEQLISGKAFGLIAVSMTQLLIWLLTILLALSVVARFVPVLEGIQVPLTLLGIVAAYFFPAFVLTGGLMTAIGSAVTDTRQGQQIAGLLNLLSSMPLFFIMLIVEGPNNPVLVALTLFPTTAFLTIVLRWSVAAIPLWQLACSWVLLVASAAFSVWAAARILRLGMLRYGQRLSLRAVAEVLRHGQHAGGTDRA
jgi:ABC-2 type transport system permease protein